jgi:threonine/homoserine/homoserine lactone efflux protein
MTYAMNLWIYFLLLAGIIIIPGMDMLLVIANALTGGLKTGFATVCGIMLGGIFHTLFGAALVTVLVEVSPQLFNPLVIAGALYMGWIGYTLARSTIRIDTDNSPVSGSAWRAFRQGTFTCILNPKAWLFVLAVYPQFLKPDFGPIIPQAVIMGLMTIATQAIVYGLIAITASRTRTLLASHPVAIVYTARAIGLAFMTIAALTLMRELV